MNPVIIYRLGSMGDTVTALPCFHLIERAFPQQERLVLTNVPVASNAAPLELILKDGGFIHAAISYPVGVRDPLTLVRLMRELRGQRAEVLVYLTESRGLASTWRDVAYFRACGFRRIIGAPVTTDLQKNRVSENGDVERESHRLGRTLEELGTIDWTDRAWWDLRLSELEQKDGISALGPVAAQRFVAVNTGGKAIVKDWGERNWTSLLHTIAKRLDSYGLVFVGAAADRQQAERLGVVWSAGPVVNLCGRLTPRVSAAALARARLFVGHDSGPLHLADAVGTPCIGLFGGHNRPKVWHPSGSTTRIIHSPHAVTAIAPQEVSEAALQAIGRSTSRSAS
jgi:heptosyltransferase-3